MCELVTTKWLQKKKMLNYCFLQSDFVIMVRLNFRWLGIQQCLRFMRTLMFPMLSECSSFCWIMLNTMRNGIIWKYEFGKGIWSIKIIYIECNMLVAILLFPWITLNLIWISLVSINEVPKDRIVNYSFSLELFYTSILKWKCGMLCVMTWNKQ